MRISSLAQIYEALNEVERSRVCREAAESIRCRISGDAVTPSDAPEEAYDNLVLWMLLDKLMVTTLYGISEHQGIYSLGHFHEIQ